MKANLTGPESRSVDAQGWRWGAAEGLVRANTKLSEDASKSYVLFYYLDCDGFMHICLCQNLSNGTLDI